MSEPTMPVVFPVLRDEIKGMITIGSELHCYVMELQNSSARFFISIEWNFILFTFKYYVAHELLTVTDNAQRHVVSKVFAWLMR